MNRRFVQSATSKSRSMRLGKDRACQMVERLGVSSAERWTGRIIENVKGSLKQRDNGIGKRTGIVSAGIENNYW
jgi:hypothetical protein